MALEVDGLVSTGATLAVGSNIVFDSVAIGASTGKVEVIKLMDGAAGSTAMAVISSGSALNAAGLQVNVVNSTSNPIGVNIANGQSSVTGNGVFHVDDNAASLTIDFNNAAISTANPLPMQLVSTSASPGAVMISSAAPASTDLGLAVRQVGFVAFSTNITISAAIPQSSVSVASLPALTTASIVRVDTIAAFPANSSLVVINAAVPQSSVTISTAGAGGSSGNPLFVGVLPQIGTGNSTFGNLKITSTATGTLFSSAASTRFNLTDIQIINDPSGGGVASVLTIYDGSTTGTKLFVSGFSSAGGGMTATFGTPRSGSSGLAIVCEAVPATTMYINAGAFKSA